MILKLKTNSKSFEMANMLLAQAINSARGNKEFMKHFKITEDDLKKAESFRKSMLHSITEFLTLHSIK